MSESGVMIEDGVAVDAGVNDQPPRPPDNEPHSRPQSEIFELSENTQVVDLVKHNADYNEAKDEEAEQRVAITIERIQEYVRLLEHKYRSREGEQSMTPWGERRVDLISPNDGNFRSVRNLVHGHVHKLMIWELISLLRFSSKLFK